MTYSKIISNFRIVKRGFQLETLASKIHTDPADWNKIEYHPFSRHTTAGSESWRIYYFKGFTPRKKIRVYESYGRSESGAEKALLIALLVGRNKPRQLESISKDEYLKNAKPRVR